MPTIRQVLLRKDDRLLGVDVQASLSEAAGIMSAQGVGALIVREDDAIVGLLSERDLVLCLARQGAAAAATPARQAMQPAVDIDIDDGLMDGLRLMTDRRRRHLLVRDGGRVVGVVSIGDLVKAVHEEQVGTISSLHQYITGAPTPP